MAKKSTTNATTVSVKTDKKGNPLPLEKQFEKMRELFSDKVDGDTRGFCLVLGPQVLYIKTETYDDEGDTAIPFVKDDPVLPKDFKLKDYPPEVQKVLKAEMEKVKKYIDEDGRGFPNVIETGYGDTFEDAIQNMLDKMILLDYGWNLYSSESEYYDYHRDFFPDDGDDDYGEDDDDCGFTLGLTSVSFNDDYGEDDDDCGDD